MPFWTLHPASGSPVTYPPEWLLQALLQRVQIGSTSFGLVSQLKGWGPA